MCIFYGILIMHYKNSIKKFFETAANEGRKEKKCIRAVRTMRITTDCPDAGNKERLALRKCVAHASIH